ncbi:hypothetical protein HY772_09350 [Candidatus Woesearchaeota archaeon]|nr:hypothetical protein [Candidatus Woesearchaeota archaeon]
MHKKVGLVLTIIIVLLVGVACSSYQAPKYKPPQTRDAFEKPYVGSDTNSSVPSGNGLSADAGLEANEETASLDDVDSLVSGIDVDEDIESASAHGASEVSKETKETKSSNSTATGKPSAPETMNLPTVVVNEGDLVKVNVKANDADGDELAFIFGPPLNSDGEWQTLKGDAGTTYAIVRVSDGKTTTTGRVKIVVRATNKLPVLQRIDDITVNEGETVKLPIVVSDPDGDSLQTTIEGWMTSSSRSTTYADAGTYDVIIKVSDGQETVSQQVKVTVKDVNRPPVIEGIFGSKG